MIPARRRPRRAVILPVTLVFIGLLALIMAGFMFFLRAESAGIDAYSDGQQARLAAESGLEELISVLRKSRDDAGAWFDNAERWRHPLVYGEGFDRSSDPVRELGSRKELLAGGARPKPAWRYSLCAPNFDGIPGTMRFGVTPESARLNFNNASGEQIEKLLQPILLELGIENGQEIINAILDWRDEDEEPRQGGAEAEYYNTLSPPYKPKNGALDSLEELLLVKGVTAAVLYGEDVNRNGILDANEDDGAASFPEYDNADGVLNRGIAPYLTIWSREPDTAFDNKPRINLNGDAGAIMAQIGTQLVEGELSAETIAFIQQLKSQNFRFGTLGSPAGLYTGGVTEGLPQQLQNSPVRLEEVPVLMDRFSCRTPAQGGGATIIAGLININCAPLRVLELIPNMTPELAAAIVAARDQFEPATRKSAAWPLTTGVVDAATFRRIAPYITTKAYQFHVESIGYADHLKISRRYEWVIEMMGSLAQIRYHRDLTGLGPAWPIDDDSIVVKGR